MESMDSSALVPEDSLEHIVKSILMIANHNHVFIQGYAMTRSLVTLVSARLATPDYHAKRT